MTQETLDTTRPQQETLPEHIITSMYIGDVAVGARSIAQLNEQDAEMRELARLADPAAQAKYEAQLSAHHGALAAARHNIVAAGLARYIDASRAEIVYDIFRD